MRIDLLPVEFRFMRREVWVSRALNGSPHGPYHTEPLCYLADLEGGGRVPTSEGWARYAGMHLCRQCDIRDRKGGSLTRRRSLRKKLELRSE